MSRSVGLLAALAVLTGCPASSPVDSDRTIQKLKEEQARLARGGTPSTGPRTAPTTDPLADAVVREEPPATVPLLSHAPATLGPVTFTAASLETMQTVVGPKVSLSTADRFARLTLHATAAQAASVDLSGAQLVSGPDAFAVARDAQRVGQGASLSLTLAAGAQQDVVLFFELPPAAIKKGLKLTLTSAQGTIELALQ